MYAGYFLVVRPTDGDLRLFWVARALTDPSPDSEHMNMIMLQYWKPAIGDHIDDATYSGWDSKHGKLEISGMKM